MREVYRQAAAEEEWKKRLKLIKEEEDKRNKEKIEQAQEDANRLVLMLLLIEDTNIDMDYVQARLDHIDEVRRADPTSRSQLRKARRIAEEFRGEMEGRAGADEVLARIDRRFAKIERRMEAIPDNVCPQPVAA